MEEAYNPFFTPEGRPVPRGPEVTTWHELISVVHSGQAVSAVAEEATRYYPWPGLAYLPIRDAPPCRWVLVWRTAGETPLVCALARAAEHRASLLSVVTK
ncbi:LysR substrate-binding domain-containing protein [Streptomyces sp. NPDC059373]